MTEGGDKILSIEGDGPKGSRVEARVRLAARSLELRLRAGAPALPFLDGAFDDATLGCHCSWFDHERTPVTWIETSPSGRTTEVERETSILGTTLISVLRKV